MNRQAPPIVFQFADERSARTAMDTFGELGYDPEWRNRQAPKPQVAIRVIGEDLTSALEIGQACGGELLNDWTEPHAAKEEEEVYAMAYDLERDSGRRDAETDAASAAEIRSASSADRDRLDRTGPEPEIPDSEEGPLYDVSADTYDHFSGDVRA